MESRSNQRAAQNQPASMSIATRMMDQDRLMEFGGYTHKDLHIQLIESAEKQMLEIGECTRIRKRVVNVLIECLGNITFHAHRPSKEAAFFKAAIAITRAGSKYVVDTTNLIPDQQVAALRATLEKLNGLAFHELTELYIETLNTDRSPDRPGAGLGFIEMARRSKQKFHYQFQKVNDKLQIFSFQVTIE